jgi:hypothetical protein
LEESVDDTSPLPSRTLNSLLFGRIGHRELGGRASTEPGKQRREIAVSVCLDFLMSNWYRNLSVEQNIYVVCQLSRYLCFVDKHFASALRL